MNISKDLKDECNMVHNYFHFVITSVACAIEPSVIMSSFQNLVFRNLFEFSAAKITSKSISPTF
jgi:hypothetical protein